MKIGIDLRILTKDANTGVEEYVKKLLSFLIPIDKTIKYKIFYNAFRKDEAYYDWMRFDNVDVVERNIPNKFLEFSNFLGLPRIDKILGGIDVFFQPHFLPAPLSDKIKRIITFHDLSFERYPDFFSWRKRSWHKIINPKKQAIDSDKIIAISESTKSDLVSLYGIAPEKIKTVYSGINVPEIFLEKDEIDCKNKYNLPDDFILFLGTLEPRKNILGVIKAFEALKESLNAISDFKSSLNRYKTIKLVIAGSPGWLYDDIFQYASESEYKNDIIFTGYVLNKEKYILYKLAKIFMFPSFFEGFGFPPLEAMACGTPVISSNTSSLPEVVGKGAIMVDPRRIDEIANAAEIILSDDNLLKELSRRGEEQARRFSWQKCAEETLSFITL